jgi:hypothetical protein
MAKSKAKRKRVPKHILKLPDLEQTTDRYLGCKQRFRNAVNDRIGLEPDASGSP